MISFEIYETRKELRSTEMKLDLHVYQHCYSRMKFYCEGLSFIFVYMSISTCRFDGTFTRCIERLSPIHQLKNYEMVYHSHHKTSHWEWPNRLFTIPCPALICLKIPFAYSQRSWFWNVRKNKVAVQWSCARNLQLSESKLHYAIMVKYTNICVALTGFV